MGKSSLALVALVALVACAACKTPHSLVGEEGELEGNAQLRGLKNNNDLLAGRVSDSQVAEGESPSRGGGGGQEFTVKEAYEGQENPWIVQVRTLSWGLPFQVQSGACQYFQGTQPFKTKLFPKVLSTEELETGFWKGFVTFSCDIDQDRAFLKIFSSRSPTILSNESYGECQEKIPEAGVFSLTRAKTPDGIVRYEQTLDSDLVVSCEKRVDSSVDSRPFYLHGSYPAKGKQGGLFFTVHSGDVASPCTTFDLSQGNDKLNGQALVVAATCSRNTSSPSVVRAKLGSLNSRLTDSCSFQDSQVTYFSNEQQRNPSNKISLGDVDLDLRFSCTPYGLVGREEPVTSPPLSEAQIITIGASTGVFVLLTLGAIVYVIVTRRSKQGTSPEEDAAEMKRKLPSSSSVKTSARLQIKGIGSLSLMKIKSKKNVGSTLSTTPGSSLNSKHSSLDFGPVSPRQGGGSGSSTVADSTSSMGSKGSKFSVSSQASRDSQSSSESRSSNGGRIPVSEVAVGALIGRGAHGRVYEGMLRGSPVAVKEFFGGRNNAAYLRELRNLRGLKHPNVVSLFGVVDGGKDVEGRKLLVMEKAVCNLGAFIAGKQPGVVRVAPFLQSTTVTITTLLQWACQICAGCKYIHSRNMIHMDIKPENLLLDGAWNIKICDLGISRSVASARMPLPDDQSEVIGTPSHSAPELLSGHSSRVTCAVDVYSFAVVFWQLLHTGFPFPSQWTLYDLYAQVVEADYRPVIASTLPAPLARIITSSWQKDPAARPTFHDLAVAINGMLGTRSVDPISGLSSDSVAGLQPGLKVFAWDRVNQRFLASTALEIRRKNPDGTLAVGPFEKVDVTDLALCLDAATL